MSENSLKLVDLDDVELIMSLEECFGVKFPEEEICTCVTMGDLYDVIRSAFSVPSTGQPVCFTAVSFYRLRRAARALKSGLKLRPSVRLSDVIEEKDWAPIWKRLQMQTGLELPSLHLGWLASCILVVLFTAPIWLSLIINQFELHWTAYFIPFVLVALGIVTLKVAPRTRPRDETFGDLAKQLAILNFEKLAREFQSWREKDMWEAVVWHCREISVAEIPITRETRLS